MHACHAHSSNTHTHTHTHTHTCTMPTDKQHSMPTITTPSAHLPARDSQTQNTQDANAPDMAKVPHFRYPG